MAAVLPFTTFTGHAFHRLIGFLIKNYTIRTMIVGLGQASFSEDTSLMECLFVASKEKPVNGSSFHLIGAKLPPNQWTPREIDEMALAATNGPTGKPVDSFVTKTIEQTELLPEKQTLSLLYVSLNPVFNSAWKRLQGVISSSVVPLRKVRDWFEKGLEITEVYHGKDRPLKLGPKAILMCRTGQRAIKDIDRLVFKDEQDGTRTFFDKFDEKTRYVFPKSELVDAIRRFSFFDSMDITGKTDFTVTNPGKSTEKTMQTFYTKEQAKDFLKRLRSDKWPEILKNGSARTNILARADLAAPGTIVLAVHSEDPAFLAGAYGYNVRGFSNEREEKLFTLWMNSTLGLLQLIAKSTITRGSWVKLEQFTTEQVMMPDTSQLSGDQWRMVEQLWTLVSKTTLPSLLRQLEKPEDTRVILDTTLLQLLGVNEEQAKLFALELEKGALEAIRMLLATMTKKARTSKKKAKKRQGEPKNRTTPSIIGAGIGPSK